MIESANVDSKQLREMLIASRKARNIGLRALAYKANLAPSTLCAIEKGRRPLTIKTATRLFSVMGISLEVKLRERNLSYEES